MKIETVIKRFDTIIETGLKSIEKEILEEGIEENSETISYIVEVTSEIVETLKRLIKRRPKKRRLGRMNNLNRRIFERDNWSCRICGFTDIQGKDISRCRIPTWPAGDDDYITLCAGHRQWLKMKLPWEIRGNGSETMRLINKEIDEYNKAISEEAENENFAT